MKPDDHVYCTNCKHYKFKIINDDGDICPHCVNEDKCDIWDSEDSRPFSVRPMYIERRV